MSNLKDILCDAVQCISLIYPRRQWPDFLFLFGTFCRWLKPYFSVSIIAWE